MKQEKTILYIIGAIILVALFINSQIPKATGIGIKVHFIKDGVEVYPEQRGLFTIVSPPGIDVDYVYFDIFGVNEGETPISNIQLVEAWPLELNDALSEVTPQSLDIGEDKLLWTTEWVDATLLEEYEQPIKFWVDVSGVDDYTEEIIYTPRAYSQDITFGVAVNILQDGEFEITTSPTTFEYWIHKKRQSDSTDGSVFEVMTEDFFGNTPETNTILKHTTPASYVPFVTTRDLIPVEGLAEYTLSVYSKADSALTSSQFIVEAYNSEGSEMGGGNLEGIGYSSYGGYYYAHYSIGTEWERHSTSFTIGENTKYLRVGFSSGADLMSQYLENARLVQVSPSTLPNCPGVIDNGDGTCTAILQDADTENLDDTYTSHWDPSSNYGSLPRMYVSYRPAYNAEYEIYLKFNLADSFDNVDILTSEVCLYVFENDLDDATEGYDVSNRIIYNDFSWDEETLTENKEPSSSDYGDIEDTNTFRGPDSPLDEWVCWDTTGTVSFATSNYYDNVSIYLDSHGLFGSAHDSTRFYSKEYTEEVSLRPKLIITYIPGGETCMKECSFGFPVPCEVPCP